jgi:hypothetical protein
MTTDSTCTSQFKFEKDAKKRALVAEAFIQDQAIRKASEMRSIKYVFENEKRDESPDWLYNLLYFLIGMLGLATFNQLFGLNLF